MDTFRIFGTVPSTGPVKKKVTIIKLPPHTTDLLQPLDVSVFKSLKDHWGDLLFKRLHACQSKLSKSEFTTLLCNEAVWKKAFTQENIQHGFRKCGIFPFNAKSYPEHRFNTNLKRRYDVWIANGKPDLSAALSTSKTSTPVNAENFKSMVLIKIG